MSCLSSFCWWQRNMSIKPNAVLYHLIIFEFASWSSILPLTASSKTDWGNEMPQFTVYSLKITWKSVKGLSYTLLRSPAQPAVQQKSCHGTCGNWVKRYFYNGKRPVFHLVSFDEVAGRTLDPFEILGSFTIEVSAPRISFKGKLSSEGCALCLQDSKLIHAAVALLISVIWK